MVRCSYRATQLAGLLGIALVARGAASDGGEAKLEDWMDTATGEGWFGTAVFANQLSVLDGSSVGLDLLLHMRGSWAVPAMLWGSELAVGDAHEQQQQDLSAASASSSPGSAGSTTQQQPSTLRQLASFPSHALLAIAPSYSGGGGSALPLGADGGLEVEIEDGTAGSLLLLEATGVAKEGRDGSWVINARQLASAVLPPGSFLTGQRPGGGDNSTAAELLLFAEEERDGDDDIGEGAAWADDALPLAVAQLLGSCGGCQAVLLLGPVLRSSPPSWIPSSAATRGEPQYGSSSGGKSSSMAGEEGVVHAEVEPVTVNDTGLGGGGSLAGNSSKVYSVRQTSGTMTCKIAFFSDINFSGASVSRSMTWHLDGTQCWEWRDFRNIILANGMVTNFNDFTSSWRMDCTCTNGANCASIAARSGIIRLYHDVIWWDEKRLDIPLNIQNVAVCTQSFCRIVYANMPDGWNDQLSAFQFCTSEFSRGTYLGNGITAATMGQARRRLVRPSVTRPATFVEVTPKKKNTNGGPKNSPKPR